MVLYIIMVVKHHIQCLNSTYIHCCAFNCVDYNLCWSIYALNDDDDDFEEDYDGGKSAD